MLRLYLTLLLAIDELLPVQEVNPAVRSSISRKDTICNFAQNSSTSSIIRSSMNPYVYPGNRNNPQAQNHQRERLWVQSV
jgi:hypothetical protein